MEWSTSCPDWQGRLRRGESIIPPPIFPEMAEQALGIFKALRIVDAPGSPTFGQCCAQWVFDLVASIFGAVDNREESPTYGHRLITEWFLLVSKKNSKSTIAAGIMQTALILNGRQSAEFSILAPTVEIANNSFGAARDMVLKDDDLDTLMHVQTHVKTITHRTSGASLKVLAADNDTVGGKKSVGTLVDELWLFGKRAEAENMLREATGGLASRPEGFVIYLTTQSDDPPAGVFLKKLRYARDVRDGRVIDPRFVPIIYEFPRDMIDAGEHLDPKNFGLVNPNLGYSVDAGFLGRELQKAQNDGPDSMRGFMAKHLDVEIGLALMSDRWVGADYWEASAAPGLTLDDVLRRSECVVVGIDGGGRDDMLGLAVLGRETSTRDWLLWTHAWLHEKALSARKSEASRYRDFEADGDLTIVKGFPDDIQGVLEVLARVSASGLMPTEKGIGLDPEKTHKVIADAIKDAGFDDKMMIGISQGWKLVGAITVAERKLDEKALHHGGQRMMNWCCGNARVEPRGNAISITKQTSGTAKIDPLMAMFNAVSLMALNPGPIGSVYNDLTEAELLEVG